MFKVEKGIEVSTQVRRSEYLEFLKGLKQGDSFAQTEKGEKVEEGQVASLRRAAKELGVKIVTRKQPDGGFRVWHCGKATAKKGK